MSLCVRAAVLPTRGMPRRDCRFMPCWLHVFKTKRHKAVQVLEEMHMVRDRKQEEMRHAGRT